MGTTSFALILGTDRNSSVVLRHPRTGDKVLSYNSFGYLPSAHHAARLTFNGQIRALSTDAYLLGHGYRSFNTVLLRFTSPDNLSPFGLGGLNSYVYCGADPINRLDPTGHLWGWIRKRLGRSSRSSTGRENIAALQYRQRSSSNLMPAPSTPPALQSSGTAELVVNPGTSDALTNAIARLSSTSETPSSILPSNGIPGTFVPGKVGRSKGTNIRLIQRVNAGGDHSGKMFPPDSYVNLVMASPRRTGRTEEKFVELQKFNHYLRTTSNRMDIGSMNNYGQTGFQS